MLEGIIDAAAGDARARAESYAGRAQVSARSCQLSKLLDCYSKYQRLNDHAAQSQFSACFYTMNEYVFRTERFHQSPVEEFPNYSFGTVVANCEVNSVCATRRLHDGRVPTSAAGR